MVVPADPGSVMELDPGGENVSFLIQVAPPTCVLLFTARQSAPAKFRSLVRFVLPSGHDWPADGERLVTNGSGRPTISQSLFNWVWKLQKRDALLLQRGMGIAQHERCRSSGFQASSTET